MSAAAKGLARAGGKPHAAAASRIAKPAVKQRKGGVVFKRVAAPLAQAAVRANGQHAGKQHVGKQHVGKQYASKQHANKQNAGKQHAGKQQASQQHAGGKRTAAAIKSNERRAFQSVAKKIENLQISVVNDRYIPPPAPKKPSIVHRQVGLRRH